MSKGKPVTQLLLTVWSNAQAATDHSWERLNTTMRRTLALAVGAGLKFSKADFEGLEKFRYGYWIGEQEWVYSMAVTEANYSAAQAYEEWMGRDPIIADNVDPRSGEDRYGHGAGRRQQERLHVGCHFVWRGEEVKVTSFTDMGAAVACSYHPPGGEYDHERRVKRRYTITRELVIEERAERKQRDAITQDLVGIADRIKSAGINCATEFGVSSMKDLGTIPFAKFKRIAERIKAKAAS